MKIKSFILLTLISVLSMQAASAKDYGKHGQVFEIAEMPLYEMIRSQFKELEKSGRLDEMNEELKRNTIAGIEAPDIVQGLGEVVEEHSYMFDPSITMPEDIDDGRGNLIVKAGTMVNPLDTVSLGDALLFIMGEKKSHLKLADKIRDELEGRVKVIFVSGEPLQAMRDNGYRIYFDQSGALVRHFDITRVPALIEQEDRLLRIREIPADAL